MSLKLRRKKIQMLFRQVQKKVELLTYVSIRSDLWGTKYLLADMSRRFLTLTKFSTGFSPFFKQAADRNSSTVMASRKSKEAI
jgi:hypothetical protein